MSVAYRITLDLAKETDNAIYGLKVGETGEKIIKVALNENGRAFQFDNEHVQLQIKKPDDNIVIADGTRVNNLCTFVFNGSNTQQLTAVAGECEAEVVVFNDTFNKSCRFSLFVEEGVISEDDIESTSIYTDMINRVKKFDVVFNVKGWFNTDASPNIITVDFQAYNADGELTDYEVSTDVPNSYPANVYLYRDTDKAWAISTSQPSSSEYTRKPMKIGTVETRTVGSTTNHYFIAYEDDIKALILFELTKYYTQTQIATLLSSKVDKETGKGLSTNDYTTAEKTKLYGIESGAEANVQSDWNESNSSADSFIKNKPITGDGLKIVTEYDEQADPYKVLCAKTKSNSGIVFDSDGDFKVDTDVIATKAFVRAVNDLANYYLKTEIYNKSEVNQLIGAIPKFKIEVVNQLPTTDISTTTVYLVRTGAESQNLYTEYIYVNNTWEKLGTQAVDLTGYATQTWVNSQIADFLTATEIASAISTALGDYYTKTQVDTALGGKVDKVSGKGLSTNDFTNDYKSKIETNEYNDIFNIRVEWDREYMPHAELIRIYYQYYESGRLTEDDPVSYNVKDITNGDVYLYKNTSDQWAIAVGTPPSSYHRLPMLIGQIATKTVNGESVKLFFRNGDDETQFDKLNNEKVDKKTWTTLLTATTTEDAVFQLDDISAGVDLNSYDEIEVIINLPSALTGRPHFVWYYGGSYSQDFVVGMNVSNCQYIVMRFKKYFGLWWAECIPSDTQYRLEGAYKSIYRDGITNLVMANFVGARIFVSRGSPAVNNLPSGTKIRIWGLK